MAVARLEDTFDSSEKRAKERAAENEERARKKQPPLPDERENYSKAARLCDQGLSYKEQALDDASFRKLLTQARLHSFAAADLDALGRHTQFDLFIRAMTEFQKAIVLYPKMARPYFELATCSIMLGRFSSAKKMLEESALCSPNNLAILNLQAEVLLQLGQWEDAARVFAKILFLEPESGRANFGLARACAALQNDARQCQAGLDALDRAEQLGVREVRPETKSDAEEQPSSIREQLTSALQRFERGEKAPPRPVLKGSATPGRQRSERAMPEAWKGSIIDK